MSPAQNTPPDPIEGRSKAAVGVRPQSWPTGIAREILIVLGIKAIALFVIWWVWFSAPEARHMQMPPDIVQHRLIEPPAAGASVISNSQPAGNDNHASR